MQSQRAHGGRFSARFPYPTKLDLLHLFWAFVLVSVAGLVVETIVSFPIDGVWKDRAGLVWGPFSPIYGLGAVLFSVCLFELCGLHPALLFAVAALVGGVFEWMAGSILENTFGFVAWSYIDQPFSIGGHTSLGIALVWGAAGLVWIRWGLPAVWHAIDIVRTRLPRTSRIVTACAAVFMAIDVAATLVAFSCWFDRQSGVPVETPVQQLAAVCFPDDFMDERFQTISMYPVLARR